jgi:hypothetical protein
MPDPSKYENTDMGKKKYMQDCMHITKQEGKSREQGLAQCLNVWKQKKRAYNVINRFISASIQSDLNKAEKSDKPSVFLGGYCKDNDWRKDLKKEFKDFIFIDPYDPGWSAEENIYDELTGLILADYVVFYKGGTGSKKEQKFMSKIDAKYMDFDDLEDLKSYLKQLAG